MQAGGAGGNGAPSRTWAASACSASSSSSSAALRSADSALAALSTQPSMTPSQLEMFSAPASGRSNAPIASLQLGSPRRASSAGDSDTWSRSLCTRASASCSRLQSVISGTSFACVILPPAVSMR